jgi:hypothetical protein
VPGRPEAGVGVAVTRRAYGSALWTVHKAALRGRGPRNGAGADADRVRAPGSG